MDDDSKRHFDAAQNCLELGHCEEAWEEIERVAAPCRDTEEFALLRLAIRNAMEDWKTAAKIARDAVKTHADCPDLYIAGAYALRRTRNVRAARRFLLEGHLLMEENGLFWFDLACYNCKLGELDEAKDCLGRAVRLDTGFKKITMREPDLEALWESLRIEWGPERRQRRLLRT